jgi:hypothetical protein
MRFCIKTRDQSDKHPRGVAGSGYAFTSIALSLTAFR